MVDVFRVVVVAEDPLVRAALAVQLAESRAGSVAIQTTPADLSSALSQTGSGQTDLGETGARVVLWDLGLDPKKGLEELKRADVSEYPVLALVADSVDAGSAIAAGASGVLGREVSAPLLIAGLLALSSGLAVFERPFVSSLFAVRDLNGNDAPREPLTPREREVLQLLATGLSNKEIGSKLGISDHTAKFHVNAILGKLGVQRRVEAVVRAARLGIVDL